MRQKIYKGYEKLRDILGEADAKKLLLVCGQAFDSMSFKEDIRTLDVEIVRFSGFTSNPLYEDICRGVRLFNEEGCDCILAIGGGSAIDVAKCIKLYCRMDPFLNYMEQECTDTLIPLIALPTTAGSGSESTRHAVFYFGGEKQSVSHSCIIPSFVILEPSVLKGLPVYQKKCTMLDALCQAVESWWSVNSTSESKEYSGKAVAAIKENWKEYIEKNTETASEKIMEASNYAGRAINITATTAAHAMSYKLTSLYHLPHGHAVAVSLPEVWEYMLRHTDQCNDSRGKNYLETVFNEIPVNAEWFRALMSDLEMEYPVSENKSQDIELLVSSVNLNRLKNNPVELSKEVIKELYERIIKQNEG